MKFEAGDKVRVSKNIQLYDTNLQDTVSEIDEFDNTCGLYREDGAICRFDERWLEKVEEVPNEDILYFAKVKQGAITPTKRDEDGCYDVYACFDEDNFVIPPRTVKLVPTGIASMFNSRYRIGIRERGSNTKGTLIVMAGQIDSGFRGEWFVALYNGNSLPVVISKEVKEVCKCKDFIQVPYSKAIAQFAVEVVPKVEVREIAYTQLKQFESKRGSGALGSSDK